MTAPQRATPTAYELTMQLQAIVDVIACEHCDREDGDTQERVGWLLLIAQRLVRELVDKGGAK